MLVLVYTYGKTAFALRVVWPKQIIITRSLTRFAHFVVLRIAVVQKRLLANILGFFISHEPHAIELADGSFLALLRVHPAPTEADRNPHFQIWKSLSHDRGRTWSVPEYVGEGSPPHLLRHSSGAIVCTQGYRTKPYGIRALVSRDEGTSWKEVVLDDSEPSWDLGYPASVELSDGSVYTVFYRDGDLLSIKWKLN